MVIIAIILWKDGEITVSDMSGEGGIPNVLQLCKALVRHDGDSPRYVAKEVQLISINDGEIKRLYKGRKPDES